MLVHVPRLVTIEVGTAPASLCADELLAVANEIADLRAGAARFVLHDRDALDLLLRVAEHTQYRDLDTIVSLPCYDEAALRGAASISPAAVALPLQSHQPLSEPAAFAAIARHEGVALELETRVNATNARELVSIGIVAAALRARRWRVDFSATRPQQAASAIIAIAGRGALAITVHALPQLRLAAGPRVSSIDRAECVYITHDGAVVIPGRATEIAGSVRRQTVAAIFNGSASYLRLRAVTPSSESQPRRAPAGGAGRIHAAAPAAPST